MACQKLAQQYAKETNSPIPTDASQRELWLHQREWGCFFDGKYHPPNECHDEKGQNKRARFNHLKEEGFMAWINERGMQCVNRLTGLFVGQDPHTGLTKTPSATQAPPESLCWGACQRPTAGDDLCFECVKQQLLKDGTKCPNVDPHTDMLKEVIECQTCLGTQAAKVPDAKETDKRNDEVWKCIVGGTSPAVSLSPMAWFLIIMGSIILLIVIIILSVWFGHIRPRHVARMRAFV